MRITPPSNFLENKNARIATDIYTASPSGLSISSATGAIDLAASTPGTYKVVYTFGNSACTDTTSTIITIKTINNNIFIPNTFTPDGDGKNDVFVVYGNSIASLKMMVYNQWGQLIFTSNSQSIGWDGMSNGKLQPVGVYLYLAQIILQDGTVQNRKGMVNLIR